MTDDPIAIFSKTDTAAPVDDLLAPLICARSNILEKHPTEKSLSEILLADPAPQLKDIKDILSAVSGNSLQLDQIFDMEKMKAAWADEKAENLKNRDEALAALQANIESISQDSAVAVAPAMAVKKI